MANDLAEIITGCQFAGSVEADNLSGWVYHDKLMVPKAAILIRDNRPLVFKKDGDRAKWLYVDTGLENDEWVEILAVHSGGSLAPEDKVIVNRARRLRNFMTQPFFVTETFTGIPGRSVSPNQTVEGVEAILNGRCDELSESKLFMIGSIDDVLRND